MKIVIPGGSGHVGTPLARALWTRGHDVVVLSRRPLEAPWRSALWDGETLGRWVREFEGAEAVIHLSGHSVNCRYRPENRRLILESRIRSTGVIGEAIRRARRPPRAWLQAGTATIYAHRFDAANDEQTGVLGGGEAHAPDTWRFSTDVARAWERVVEETVTPATRKVILRSAMILGTADAGIFDTLLRLVRHGLGGRAGNGRQYVSWIHEDDFLQAIVWIIAHETLEGPINVCAPNPLPNSAFMRALRGAWGTKLGLPAPRLFLEAGALLMGTETELVLKSRRVVPGKLQASGFGFGFPSWPEAARNLCRRWRKKRETEGYASQPRRAA
jgi:uncharacterized protein